MLGGRRLIWPAPGLVPVDFLVGVLEVHAEHRPEAVEARSRTLAPSSLRFVVNWTQEVQRLLATK